MTPSTQQVQASLFVTCIIDQFYPEVGESTVRVLERLGVKLDFPQAQTCCGQPAYNAGFWTDAKPLARRVLVLGSESPRYLYSAVLRGAVALICSRFSGTRY